MPRVKKEPIYLTVFVNPLFDRSRRPNDGLYANEGIPRNEYEEKMQFATSFSPQSLFSVSCERHPISRLSFRRRNHPLENDLQSLPVQQTYSIQRESILVLFRFLSAKLRDPHFTDQRYRDDKV